VSVETEGESDDGPDGLTCQNVPTWADGVCGAPARWREVGAVEVPLCDSCVHDFGREEVAG